MLVYRQPTALRVCLCIACTFVPIEGAGRQVKGLQVTEVAQLGFSVWLLVPADTAYVRVSVSDVNDNQPAFAQSVYEVSVDEDQDVGSTILTVTANDEDEGKALQSPTALSKILISFIHLSTTRHSWWCEKRKCLSVPRF